MVSLEEDEYHLVDPNKSFNIENERNNYRNQLKDQNVLDVNNKGSPDKPGGLSIQLCKSEKKEFYIRYSS